MSVQESEVAKLHATTKLCGLQTLMDTYIALKGPLQCQRCQRCNTVVMHPSVLLLVRLTSQESALAHRQLLGLCEVEGGQGGAR